MIKTKGKPGDIDEDLGSRLRMARMTAGLTQQDLGEILDITFQQVQKYEKGTNRVAASKIPLICDVLQISPSYFFDYNHTHHDLITVDEAKHIGKWRKLTPEERRAMSAAIDLFLKEGA